MNDLNSEIRTEAESLVKLIRENLSLDPPVSEFNMSDLEDLFKVTTRLEQLLKEHNGQS